MFTSRRTGNVLGSQIEVATLHAAAETIGGLAKRHQPAYVCFATAHMLAKNVHDEDIHRSYAEADLVAPDGRPVAWCLRLMGFRGVDCISGPLLVPLLLENAVRDGTAVGFYGGREETLRRMRDALYRQLPALRVVYLHSPPFRTLEPGEQEDALEEIRASGAELLFVGLGSPKQELWMNRHHGSLDCVCLGVGAAFEFLSGEKVLPPLWVQRLGLTWLVRLCQEPRRLAVRNLYSPVFVGLFALQHLFGVRFGQRFAASRRVAGTSE